jgi:SAM-dependent methyltransferase
MHISRPQVPPEHYQRPGYLDLAAYINHWYQADTVLNLVGKGGRVLEIGLGSGHTTWLMRLWGLEVVTSDIDPALGPDLVADVSNLPMDANSFDCILIAEVLEHLPFDLFVPAVRELARVSKKHVVITLPEPRVGVATLVNLPTIQPLRLALGLPFRTTLRGGGEHFWELGRKGYPCRRIRKAIGQAGLRIVQEFRPGVSLYCRFFVCENSAAGSSSG